MTEIPSRNPSRPQNPSIQGHPGRVEGSGDMRTFGRAVDSHGSRIQTGPDSQTSPLGIGSGGDRSSIPEAREAVVADGLMTVPEAAAFLRLSRSTLYNLMDSGRLPYVRLVGNGRRAARRIPRKAVVALAAAHLVGGNVNTNRAER